MGGSQSNEQKLEIINDTRMKSAFKNMNENINTMTMNIIQENLKQEAASAVLKQEIIIKDVVAEGDIIISGSKQSSNIEISLSSLTNSELKQF